MVTSKETPSGLQVTWEGAKLASSLTFPIDPVPASRPRVTRWGTYHTKPYKNWLDQAEKLLKGGAYPGEFFENEDLMVRIESVVTKARTSKLHRPKGDVDNYAKGPMDAITRAGLHWHDDSQVVSLVSSKRFAKPGEPAHTLVEIYALRCA